MCKKAITIFFMSGLLVVMFVSLWSPAACAWTTSKLRVVNVGGDYIYNYDFESKSTSSSKVDWPVTMMFTGNANINKVKNLYSAWTSGSSMYMRLNDGAGWVWDSDGGKKSWGASCSCHIRLYADSDDRLYNLTWGYFVIGTSHYDIREIFPDRRFGWSEDAAGELTRYIEGNSGVSFIQRNSINMYNYEAYRVEYEGSTPRHYWQNNGYATRVQLY